MLRLRDAFTLSVYAPLNSSRSTAEEINSNLFHCSELGSLIPLTPGFSLLLFIIFLQLCRCWVMDGAECNLSERGTGIQMAKPITPIISTHLELLLLSSVHLCSSFCLYPKGFILNRPLHLVISRSLLKAPGVLIISVVLPLDHTYPGICTA